MGKKFVKMTTFEFESRMKINIHTTIAMKTNIRTHFHALWQLQRSLIGLNGGCCWTNKKWCTHIVAMGTSLCCATGLYIFRAVILFFMLFVINVKLAQCIEYLVSTLGTDGISSRIAHPCYITHPCVSSCLWVNSLVHGKVIILMI